MNGNEPSLALERLKEANGRLEEALDHARSDLERDGVIQRFEFTVELLWKTLSIVLRYNGIDCTSPRDCIKKAFRHGFIEDGEILLDMIEDRNRSSHVYNQEIALAIFQRIRERYRPALRRTITAIEQGLES